jgi:hypothetical protein
VLEVTLPQEVFAQRLRFEVTDFANPPLELQSVESVAAVRKVLFEMPAERYAWPVRLYFGNADASPARYDLEKTLPATLKPEPIAVTLGEREANPAYVPPTAPFNERYPWVIYLVLGIAAAVLFSILMLLARRAARREEISEHHAPSEKES